MSAVQTGGPNLSWLDEELRRQKSIVEELRNMVDKQQILLVDQSQRMVSLEDRITKLQNQLQALPELRQNMQNTRDEVVSMIGDLRQDMQKRELEGLRTRQGEREKDLRAIQEIRMELDRLAPLEQAAAVGEAEDRRINESVLRLQGQLEGLHKGIAQGEEGRRQLLDAISRNTVEIKQLADDTADLHTIRPALTQRILALENDASKLSQQIGELQEMRNEVTAQQAEMQERQRRSDRERAQTLTDWGRKLDAVGHQIDTWADQLRYFSDQHEKNRNVLRDVQALAQDLSQQQDRMRQVQRITEEQLRQEQREARVEHDQRWAQEIERRELAREAQVAHDDAQDARLGEIEQAAVDLSALIASVHERLESVHSAFLSQAGHARDLQQKALKAATRDLSDMMSTLAQVLGTEG
jgi:phage shock protein A